METIKELAADERTARVILALASEPADSVTGQLLRTVGATETVARVIADEPPPGPDGDTWQRRLAPRINTAGYRSGTLHTAAQAVELRRPLGAVPGPITSAASAGCHRLMQDGLASVITGYDDVRALLDGVREGAQRSVRRTAGLENDPLDPAAASRSQDRSSGRGLSL